MPSIVTKGFNDGKDSLMLYRIGNIKKKQQQLQMFLGVWTFRLFDKMS